MHLVVRIPYAATTTFPDAVSLARLAPSFTIEGHGEEASYVAIFTDLPRSLDLAVRLIEAVVAIPGIWVSINTKRVGCLTKFWSAFICYRDSLDAADPREYCADKAKRYTDTGSCPDQGCLSPCQFMCVRCLGVDRSLNPEAIQAQLEALAVQAEVDWCPNLQLKRAASHHS